MPTLTPQEINVITDFESLLRFLHDKLDWPVDPSKTIEDVTFDYTADELRVHESAAARLHGGIVRQLRDVRTDQKIGVFFVEFDNDRIYATALRQVLRGLVPNRRQSGQRRTWDHENILFVCSTKNYEQFTFAHFSGNKHATAKLSMFGWQRGDTHLRTLCEFNLPALAWPTDLADADAWLKSWSSAFDVEKVTDEFFRRYNEVFTAVEQEVRPAVHDDRQGRLFTQKLFNRLMFIYFIQKKGWLSFKNEPKDKYLRALFNDALARKQNFFSDRLYWLFFRGMSVADMSLGQTEEQLKEKRGEVPPLNGGLFEIEDELDVQGRVPIKNDVFGRILDLFERYNFTIEESTPLDVQVAVDPEMLGKVFEELVTGRHETGSYYTPRPIVSFMCREALKHYLDSVQPSKEALAKFVDEQDASDLQNPEAVLDALKRVRVCDPACGSGAYLLGMLHELMRLRAALFRSNKIDDATRYERKRWIIENNLYGVDNDAFAVQIACLRLWLSLSIDSDKPRPLPNLDYKIEVGDSLIAPAPSEAEKQMTFARTALVNEFREAKGEYMRENDPERKLQLRQRVDSLRTEIALELKHKSPGLSEGQIQKKQRELSLLEKNIESARNASVKTELQKQAAKLRRTLAVHESASAEAGTGFDWAVEFAEVFTPAARERWRMDDLHPMLNNFKRQGTLVEEMQPNTETGGFDVVLANPPYIRQELIGREYKEGKLKPVFPEVYSGTADLYIYFYARTAQLLRQGGVGVFISSNKWLRAGYGEKLRQELLDKQAFHLIVDFGELPVFKAATFPAIFVWQQESRGDQGTTVAIIKDLRACYVDGLREHVESVSRSVPASQFASGKARLALTKSASSREIMEKSGARLGDFTKGQIFYGIKTGCNDAFIIDASTKDSLVSKDPHSLKVIKPVIHGDDIRRYEIHWRGEYMLYIPWDFKINDFPAIRSHLTQHKAKLLKRAEAAAERHPWYALTRYASSYVDVFNLPKIVYPEIAKESRFALDFSGHYPNKTIFSIPLHDFYLLGVLNSASAWNYLKEICSVLGDEESGGRLTLQGIFLETLPIPDASPTKRRTVAQLAKQAQDLHAKRRKRVEKLLRDIGTRPAQLSSRNPLEHPWTLTADEFTRRARNQSLKKFTDARDETLALTEQITKIEREIDERVAALYGVPLDAK